MIQIDYQGARFELQDGQDGPCCFVFGVRKSGSSIFNSIVQALAMRHGLPFADVGGELFKAGITVARWQPDPALGQVLRPGNVYGGFRNFPLGLTGHPLYQRAAKALLVRDPRDALVSEFFSNAFSHSLPEAGEARDKMLALRREAQAQSIEAFVLARAPQLARTLTEYLPYLNDPGWRLFHYEDVILDKRRWMMDLCAHFGWPFDAQHAEQVLGWADVRPADEDPTRFVRKVLPGDHRDKLSEATIAALNRSLAVPMRALGYVEHAAA
jgi:hypothetical protein